LDKHAQISLEFLIYLAISAISLLFILSIYIEGTSELNSSVNNAYLGSFVSAINSNMNYYESNVQLYVPKSICNCTSSNEYLSCAYEKFKLYGNLSITKEICLNSGSIETMDLYYSNGKYMLYSD